MIINLKYANTHTSDLLYVKELNQAPDKVEFEWTKLK
jgi:hypothetical protein